VKFKPLPVLAVTLLVFFSSNLFANDLNSCVLNATKSVTEQNPELKSQLEDPTDLVHYYIKLDCKEAGKITQMNSPYSDSIGALSTISKLATLMSFGGIPNAMEIMTPYCRQNHEYFGSFCMAADIYSANEILNDRIMLEMLPKAITTLSNSLKNFKNVNFINLILPLFPKDQNRAVTLASYIGLDDNGTQTMRLKASLLKLQDFERYAKLFTYLTDGLTTIDADGETTLSPITRVFFATRVGTALVSGVKPGSSKTYKAYAAAYFGCKMSEDGYGKDSTLREISFFGYSYEMIKIKQELGPNKPIGPIVHKYHKMGSETAAKMRAGATVGYELCK
jgi:hypothetical protein